MELTQAYLKSILHYDPETGNFISLKKRHRIKEGKILGCKSGNGYHQCMINGKIYLMHRLAFLYMTGSFPHHHTDHINGIKADNRWGNLRAVTTTENLRNQKRSKNNTSGVTGVRWDKRSRKWGAFIYCETGYVHLGFYDNLLVAAGYRKIAESKYGYHSNHGRNANIK